MMIILLNDNERVKSYQSIGGKNIYCKMQLRWGKYMLQNIAQVDKIHTVKSSLGGQKNIIKSILGKENVYYKQSRHWGEFNKLKTNY